MGSITVRVQLLKLMVNSGLVEMGEMLSVVIGAVGRDLSNE